jgi:hypothetical protein
MFFDKLNRNISLFLQARGEKTTKGWNFTSRTNLKGLVWRMSRPS